MPKTRPLEDTRSVTNEYIAAARWTRRRDIPLAILAWTALGVLALWAASHIATSLIVLGIAGVLAFAIRPAVSLLERFMPRLLAILIVYILFLGGICVVLYFVISTAIQQITALSEAIRTLMTPQPHNQDSPLMQLLHRLGITDEEVRGLTNQLLAQVGGFATSALPVVTSIFQALLDVVIVMVLSIYLLIDGDRATRWLRTSTPLMLRNRVSFMLDTIERVVGGYIRGQVTLCLLIGVLVGVGMFILRVPFAVLLGVLAFFLEFIPVLGTLVSGAFCVLIALTQGWLTAVLVLAYFVGVHILEGDVIGPRVVGKAVGLHPVISLFALIAGAELFGIIGALFASPIAGVVQALLVAIWQEWRRTQPEEFPEMEEELIEGDDQKKPEIQETREPPGRSEEHAEQSASEPVTPPHARNP